jgi:serine/threonine-protein kinase HipA
MLFRQMVFNVLIGNTDDHLKNFCMMHDDEGWRLSPAFDLAPNIGFNLEHVLRIGMSNKQPDLETLLTEAKYFGIKRREPALDIIVNIHNVVSTWESVFTACEVPSKDAETIGVDINQRLKKTLFLG